MSRFILDSIPDLHVVWDYNSSHKYEYKDLEPVELKGNIV